MQAPIAAERLTATIRNLRLPVGLTIDALELEAEGLSIVPEPFSVSANRPGTFAAALSDVSVESFLRARMPSMVRQVDLAVEEGRLVVNVVAKVLIEVRARAVCTLEVQNSRQIRVALESVEPGGPVRGILESQLDAINPVFDAADLPLMMKITAVEARPGMVVINGTFLGSNEPAPTLTNPHQP